MIESVTYYFVYRVICYLPSYSYVSMTKREHAWLWFLLESEMQC